MAKAVKLTKEGYQQYKEELEDLQSVKRSEMADSLKEARSYGDLSENSEYDEAKNEQGKVETRIKELEEILKNAVIIDSEDLSTEQVSIGNKVVLKDLETGEEMELHIVGSKEVDMKNGKISDESPVGKACLGRTKGETIDVEAPAGIMKFKILDIGK